MSRLLSGLLVATALYSLDLLIMGGGDISLASTRTLPTQAFDAVAAVRRAGVGRHGSSASR